MASSRDIYKKGDVNFYGFGYYFDVTKDVYIPTPESKHLVKEAVEQAIHLDANLIVDVGTGSGALAIDTHIKCANFVWGSYEYLKLKPYIIAADISEKALKIAQKNIERYKLSEYITIQKSNYVDDLVSREPDIIMANLPWGSRYTALSSNIERGLNAQPPLAIFHPDGPMGAYKELFESIKKKGWDKSVVIFETGKQNELSVDRILPKDYKLIRKEWKRCGKLYYSIGIAYKRI